MAACLTRDQRILEDYHAYDTAAELLGLSGTDALRKLGSDLTANGDGHAHVVTLSLVLGALEARCPKDAWRSAGSTWRSTVSSREFSDCLVIAVSWRSRNLIPGRCEPVTVDDP